MTVLSKNHQGKEQKEGRSGGNGGKTEWKLSESNTRSVSRGKNKLIGKFKMVQILGLGYEVHVHSNRN
jgi:hypothetical protein